MKQEKTATKVKERTPTPGTTLVTAIQDDRKEDDRPQSLHINREPSKSIATSELSQTDREDTPDSAYQSFTMINMSSQQEPQRNLHDEEANRIKWTNHHTPGRKKSSPTAKKETIKNA